MLATYMLKSSKIPAVGVDLGGTTVKAALVSPRYEILSREAVPTDLSSQSALLDSIVGLVETVRGQNPIEGVGFGLPSQVNQLTGRVAASTNVPIADIAFKEQMATRLGVPVEIDNDANVACFAETITGVAQGLSHVIMLTLGTGVGGGIVADGRIYRGATGYAGELGHMVVEEDGPPCQGHCPNRGCLEVMASAIGVLHAAGKIADATPRRHPRGCPQRRQARRPLRDRARPRLRPRVRRGAGRGRTPARRRHLELHQHLQPTGNRDRRRDLGGGRARARPRPGRGLSPGAALAAGRGDDRTRQARERRRRPRCRRADPVVTGRLTVCPTPIGNLGDITVRAIDALRDADLIACEDTRRTRTLCAAYDIGARLISLHEHNERARAAELVERIAAGARVALVSDAGMPLVSDPGATLVAAVLEAGLDVDVLPGASAVTTAIATSGLSGGGFVFGGFLPRGAGPRAEALARLDRAGVPVVVFESPRRLRSLLAAVAEATPDGGLRSAVSSPSSTRRSCEARSRRWPSGSPMLRRAR